jgi:hypothetical protein
MNERADYIGVFYKGVEYRYFGGGREVGTSLWERFDGRAFVPVNGIYIPGEVLRAVVSHHDFIPGDSKP